MNDSLQVALAEIVRMGGDAMGFLKEKAPWFWEVMIRQVWIEAVTDVLWAVPLLVVLVVAFKRLMPKALSDDYNNDGWAILWGLVGIVGFVVGILSIIAVVSLVRVCLNPEYYVLKKILMGVS